jgi:hypothetical protein
VIDAEPDRLDEAQMEDLRRELAGLSDAALARSYEIYRIACGLRQDRIPRPATMQRFWRVWEECRGRLERSLYRRWGITSIRVTLATQVGITDRVWVTEPPS